ncbi:hypothetical protein TCAL_06038 [Tigriopus californicus]|uniref:Prostaglandin reductase 1 n=1 Tax=Tigriopus californicus TaxID=6832 RepID=A0A553P6S7_TIGCA|nr:prostaglandin reductase 1-like [Tigriopus californicus]TRY73330.1 hypothetical protein TCAL_06038 [Tigriopus californicus]
MVLARRWALRVHFQGAPKLEDFELVQEELEPLQDGEIFYQSEFISVDPYQRNYTLRMPIPPPFTMPGSVVGQVKDSRNLDFPVGTRVVVYDGWREAGIINPTTAGNHGTGLDMVRKAPDIGNLPLSLLLGACGMPGNTAYFGVTEICRPQKGETVLVTGAAGAVGSLVGQISKVKGCKVIGFAGSDDKVAWLKDNLAFDEAFNYKKTTMETSLSKGVPQGVDCFFDNVGGEDASSVIAAMNVCGRVACCGAIASYNVKEPLKTTAIQYFLIRKRLKMEGFQAAQFKDRWDEGVLQMAKWIQEGKLKPQETVVDGFENTPNAFMGLFSGDNLGKMVVKV